MTDEPWRQAIAEVRTPQGRGTAFLIADRQALTAWHVLKGLLPDADPQAPQAPQPASVTLQFFDGSAETWWPAAWSQDEDWALLTRDTPSSRPPLRPMLMSRGAAAWRTAGFPDTHPQGLNLSGQVTGWQVPGLSGQALQLRCDEALAGNLLPQGLSGAPCIVGENGVIGLLRRTLLEDFTAFNAAGTLFACGMHTVIGALQARGFVPHTPLQPQSLPRLCELQRGEMLAMLHQGAPFEPGLHTPREPLEDFLVGLARAHDVSPRRVCAIVGGSGVGKTQLLASVASQAPAGAAVLLLRARWLDGTSQSLGDEVLKALARSAAAEGAPTGFDVDDVWRSGATAPRLVLLDALNELPSSLDAQAWIERSLRWLQEQPGTRLVLSCRPEYWDRFEALVPRDWLFGMPAPTLEPTPEPTSESTPGRRTPPSVAVVPIRLGDFTADEAADASARAFGEQVPGPVQAVVHPLLLRIYRDLARDARAGAPPLGKLLAFEAFVKHHVDAASRQVADVRARDLRGALLDLARTLALQDDAALPRFDRMLESALAHTGLVEWRNDLPAFVHDEVLEFLASGALSLTGIDQGSLTDPASERAGHRIGAVKFALMRTLSARPQDPDARQLLRSLLRNAPWALDVVADVLVALPDATGFIDEARQYLSLRTWGFVRSDERRVVAQLQMPTAQKLRLLLDFRDKIYAYDFEPHHWKDLARYVLNYGPMDWVPDVIRADPAGAFDELATWLDDTALLSDSKSRVFDLAGGLMYHFAELDFERVCRALLSRGSFALESVLTAHPQQAETFCLQLLSSPNLSDVSSGTRLYDWMACHTALPVDFVPAVRRALARFKPGSVDYRHLRRTLLAAAPEERQFNAELLDELAAGKLGDSGNTTTINHLLHSDLDAVLALLAQSTRQDSATLTALSTFVGTLDQHTRIAGELRRMCHSAGAGSAVAMAVEWQLNRTPADFVEHTGLLALARELLLQPGGNLAAPVFYAAFGGLRQPALNWPYQLLQEAIGALPSPRVTCLLLEKLDGLQPLWPLIADQLGAMRQQLGDQEFARALLLASALDARVAAEALQWCQHLPALQDHPLLQAFCAQAAAGASPRDAAFSVLQTMSA